MNKNMELCMKSLFESVKNSFFKIKMIYMSLFVENAYKKIIVTSYIRSMIESNIECRCGPPRLNIIRNIVLYKHCYEGN